MSTSVPSSSLAVRQSSLLHLQERLAIHGGGPCLTVPHRALDGLKRREHAALSCFMYDVTAVIVTRLHAAGALSPDTARPVELLEQDPELAGVDLSFILDRITTEGILGMFTTGADDLYWIS